MSVPVLAAIPVVPRIFIRTFTDREKIPTANATVRLYDYGRLVIEQDVELLVDKTEAGMVYGLGQTILIDGDRFSFDRCTMSLKEFPEIAGELPVIGRHTVTRGNTVTLEAHPKGFMSLVE